MTDGTTTWAYTYNTDGLRTSRTNGTTTYEYIYNGSQLTQMTVGTNTLYFAYDASGTPLSVTYNGTAYYYVTNIQGDVTGIIDNTGTQVVSYSYDAWGNILSTDGTMKDTLGALNPLRYRGYAYDTETELYYLSTRYYSPNLGRFLNADAFTSTGQGLLGNNMFAYCGNNPVSRMDDDGEKWTYTIEKAETNILEEETDRTVYQTTIVFSGENTNLFGTATKTIPSTEVTLKYSISNDGAIAFDNVQDDAVHLKIDAVRNKLAAEMYNVCTNSVRNSLSRHTIAGISNELYWHYIFSFTKSGKTANIGGSNQDDPGRDSNGWLFEIFCVKQ